ncbi:MAG TPA: choice-of-anchor D domain-containing protein [Caldimonas sp.]|jgi:hypothetical protein|nr:choice-of-anchor D domain-containing protein [Caldimonas sp.]HEX2543013.1 choice-of-anchor D domain-containing protein [Caldimonas sp.]
MEHGTGALRQRRSISARLRLGVWAAGLLVAAVAQAQAPAYYTGNGCVGCHGNPPKIGSPTDNRAGLTIIGVGTAPWLADDDVFKARLLQPLVPEMTTLANEGTATNRNIVRQYLINLRDGVISTNTRTFGSTNIGATSSLPVTLTNHRHLDASFTVTKSGTNSGDFTISGCGLNASGLNGSVPNAVVGAAGSCALSVVFGPSAGAATSRTASFTVNYNGNEGGNPLDQVVSLSGTVPPAVFSFAAGTTTTTARFDLAQSSDSNVGTITNTGQATLSINSITRISAAPVGATYAQVTSPVGACASPPFSLGAGQSCNVFVRYTPTLAGTTSATFRITPSVGSTQDFTLQGTGVRPLINPASPPNLTLAFGNSQQGVPKVLPQVIANSGDAPLTFTVSPTAAGARSGSHPGDFSVALVCGVGPPIPAGGSCTLNVSFTPTALGPRSALLTISSDATNGPLLIDLTGTGVALPEPVVTYPATDFPDTVIGESAAQTRIITIRNDRTRDITYSVAGVADFTLGAESCAGRVVPGAGGSCTVAIQFQPTLGSGDGLRQAAIGFTFAGTGGDADPSNATGNVAGRALLPLGQSSTTLNAAAVVGSPATASMLLTNRASTPLTISALGFSGANAAEFTLDATNGCTAGIVLAASANCTLVVRFAPALPGTRTASLALTHSKPGSPQAVALQGTATPAPQGRIELGSLALVFPNTQLGATSTQNVVVRNSGDLTLTFSAFTIGGAAAAEFERGGDCSTAAPLPIGAQCTLSVTFRPGATLGARAASLTIASDASNGPATLSLSGTAIPVPVPAVTLAPTSLDFGVQTAGGLYPARRIRLSNSGTADLAIASIAVEGAGFSNASAAACPPVLTPGAGCDIDIALLTTSAAPFAGTLRVTSNAAGSPHTAALTGSGSAAAVAVLTWSPLVTSLDFGAVSAGSISAVQSVNLLNQGPGGVNLTVLNAVGADAAAFSVVGGTCAIGTPLFQGESCRVDIRFAPGSAGAKSATVQVASTGSFPPALSLAGVGLGGPSPSLAVSATALTFPTTRVGAESLPAEIRLTSNGSSIVRVTALDVTGAYAIHGSTCPPLPFTLPAGTDCTVTLSFRPATEGSTVGMLRVTSESDPAVREVALSGSGEAAADVSSGGCTIGAGTSLLDPTLWLLMLLAIGTLLVRRRQHRRSDRSTTAREPAK